MSGLYDDIINLPHHVSQKHPQMSMQDRAAQFSPFAALTGHGAAIRETERETTQQAELDEDELELLDTQLRYLQDHLEEQPEVTITYFEPDRKKEGGSYTEICGKVRKIDLVERFVQIVDKRQIPIDRILEIAVDVQHSGERLRMDK